MSLNEETSVQEAEEFCDKNNKGQMNQSNNNSDESKDEENEFQSGDCLGIS